MFSTLVVTKHFHFILDLCSSSCWFKLIIFIFRLKCRFTDWLFPVSWIPLDNCMGSFIVCELSDMSGLVELLLSIHCDYILHSALLSNYLVSDELSLNDIPSMDLSVALCAVTSFCSSFFVVVQILLVYNITSKMVLLKRLACKVLSSFLGSRSFILVNIFHSNLILHEISAFMFWHIFTICFK